MRAALEATDAPPPRVLLQSQFRDFVSLSTSAICSVVSFQFAAFMNASSRSAWPRDSANACNFSTIALLRSLMKDSPERPWRRGGRSSAGPAPRADAGARSQSQLLIRTKVDQ